MATGGVIYPVMLRQLLSSVGFPWAVRSIAFVMFGTYLFSYTILIHQPTQHPAIRRWIDLSAFKDLAFLLAIGAAFLSSIAYYQPLLYLPLFAETSISEFNDADLAFYLLSIVNGASVIGRLAGGLIAMRLGPMETCTLFVFCSSLLLLCWIPVKSTTGVIIWSVVWGLISSVIIAMQGAMVPLLCQAPETIGTRTGMYWAGAAVGILIGSPIGGTLIDTKAFQVDWTRLQVFAGISMLGGALFCVYPMMSVRRRRQA